MVCLFVNSGLVIRCCEYIFFATSFPVFSSYFRKRGLQCAYLMCLHQGTSKHTNFEFVNDSLILPYIGYFNMWTMQFSLRLLMLMLFLVVMVMAFQQHLFNEGIHIDFLFHRSSQTKNCKSLLRWRQIVFYKLFNSFYCTFHFCHIQISTVPAGLYVSTQKWK